MTRGKFCLVFGGEMYISVEFNGGMGDYYYPEIMEGLKKVRDPESFVQFVEGFNDSHFEYDDDPLVYGIPAGYTFDEMTDMTEDYFEKWFSDYVYILCLDEEVTFRLDGGSVFLEEGGIGIAHFGRSCSLKNDFKENVEECVDKLLSHTSWSAVSFFEDDGEHIVTIQPLDLYVEDDFSLRFRFGTVSELAEQICEYARSFDAEENVETMLELRGRSRYPGIRQLLYEADLKEASLSRLADEIEKTKREVY